MVISPLPEGLRREIRRLLEGETRVLEALTRTSRLNGLVLLFEELPDPREKTKPRPRPFKASGGSNPPFSTDYRVQLHQFQLLTELSPNKSFGQLCVTSHDGEPVVINLSLYRYLCMHTLVMKSVHASSSETLENDRRAVLCSGNDMEDTFYQFGEENDFVQASDMAGPQIVDFIQLTKRELKNLGVADLIMGRLDTGFYLNTLPQNVTFLPAAAPWLEGVE